MAAFDIPRRRPRSLFDDPDADARHAREMQRYRAARAAGKPYIPGEPVGPAESLFGDPRRAPARDGAAADLAPPVERDNALPELLAESEAEPRGEPSEQGAEGISLYELLPPGTVLDDAQPEGSPAGDRLANKRILTNIDRGVVFRAYYKNDKGAHGGRQEHARHGPGGEYHFHLYDTNGKAGPRISSESFLPVEGDEPLFTGKFKAAIESLTDAEKRYLHKANREVFHTGKLPIGLLIKLGMEKALSRGLVLPRGQE